MEWMGYGWFVWAVLIGWFSGDMKTKMPTRIARVLGFSLKLVPIDDDDNGDCDDDDDDDGCDHDGENFLLNYVRPLGESIEADDREAFLRLTENYYDVSFPRAMRYVNFVAICLVGAINCASALFELEPPDTIPFVDINVPIYVGNCPLNVASTCFHYDLVDLFLRHGARTDLVSTRNPSRGIPLKQVLDLLDYHDYLIDWNPKNSIYTLVTILCLPQMRVILETLKLLVWNTKDVNEVFNYYAEKEEGKLVQMAVLIMVAKELLQSKGDSFFAVKQEFEFLATLESKLLVTIIALKDRMAYLMYVLALFELFDKAGDAIRSYLHSRESNLPTEVVIEDVTKILMEARFNLKHGDIDLKNIDLFEPGMSVPHLQKDVPYSQHKALHPLEYEFPIGKWKHLPNTRSMGLVNQHELNETFNPPWSPALRTTKPQTKCYLSTCCPNNAFYKPIIKVQNKGITSPTTRGNLLLFPKPTNLLASFALI